MSKATLAGATGADARLREGGDLIDRFDTYFPIYLGLKDSAECWSKRGFWRLTGRRRHEEESEKAAVGVGAPPSRADS